MSGDKLKALRQWEKIMQAMDKQLRDFKRLSGAKKSPLIDAIFNLQLKYTQAVAKNIGDECGWIVWYQLNNGMGAKRKKAGIEGAMREIKTLEDLLWLIEVEPE